MLKNGNFEQDWGESHEVLICRPGRTPTLEIRDNIFTPESWLTWFYYTPDAPEPDRYEQPEVRDAHKSGDPRRVHEGEKAILLFTFWRRHLAGFLQQVQVEPGQHLQLTAWAHAWSNWNDGPHPDDPRWSEGAHVGYEAVALREGTLGLDDADRNFTFSVGIDPTGGTNPFADTVVWGRGSHIYNEHAQVPAAEATAQANVVTVFLRSKTLWRYKHNDAYWDSVELTEISTPPPPLPCRGHPRVQYERTYVLLPPSAGVDWANAVVDATWNTHRLTLGGSADDAGVADLDVRKIIAVNPGSWPGDLAAFYGEHYPGVTYEPMTAGTPDELHRKLKGETPPPPPPPPPVQGNPISLHLQSMDPGWDTYLRDAKPNVIKVLASMHDVVGVKRVAPDTTVIWRHVDNNYNGILDNPDPHVGARRWIAKFRDSLYARCDEIERDCPGVEPPYFYVESINEVYPSRNAAAVTRAVNFDIAFIEELNALNLPIRAVVFTAGIGNPHESEYELLVPLARIVEQYGALMGYHNYFWVNHGASHLDSDWEWHAGRWAWIDEVFVQHGIHVTWFGAESGAHFSCVDGWRAPTCFDGDWDSYETSLVHLRDKIAQWNNAHDNRYLGLVLFSTGLGLGWDSWHIGHTEMEKLTRALTT